MPPTIIGILGKPLSGKDTVANDLRERFSDVAAISMGDVIREVKVIGPKHRFWEDLQASIDIADKGGIAPDGPVFDCFTKLVEEKVAAGYNAVFWVAGPRTVQQLGWLDDWVKEKGFRELFVHVDVSDHEIYNRLLGRSEGRADDQDDVVAFRLKEFERLTRPVIDRLRREGRLTEISGIGPKEIVGDRAVEALTISRRDPEVRLPVMARR